MLYSVSEPSESELDGEFCLTRKRIAAPRLEHRIRIPSGENINRDPENNQDGDWRAIRYSRRMNCWATMPRLVLPCVFEGFRLIGL
ncbi:MAG: hypothetical protein DWI02_08710 [Planctomycetota bacterium]|nr:MAG: hypothetical protein DWI02_08710 [Planctomycetota bacterium]